MFEEFAS